MAVSGDAGTVPARRGHDFQCVGRHRAKRISPFVLLFAAAGGLAVHWPDRNVCVDAHRLSQAARAGGRLSGALRGWLDARRRFFS